MIPSELGEIQWDTLKNERLKKVRGASFEEILDSKYLGIWNHPSRPLQKVMLFEYKGYVWLVPFVRQGSEAFLKTLYRSRKYTKRYKRGELG